MSQKENITLASAVDCTGCFACEGVCPKHAITHRADKEGFNHPVINSDLCVHCHACEKVCPVLNPIEKTNPRSVYAGWSLSESIRTSSSSGGLFSELAKAIIADGGVVVGAEMDAGGLVSHTIVSEVNELYRHRGSKYVQSDIKRELYGEIKKVLTQNKKVLFTGTPCQVAGVKSFFKNSPLLFTVDIICHGVPSPVLFKDVYDYVKSKYGEFNSFNFRFLDKWGEGLNVSLFENGGRVCKPLSAYDSYYLSAFDKGLLNRECCYHCSYATNKRVGDITIGDFWGIGTTEPFTKDTREGCSIVIVNTEKGEGLLGNVSTELFLEKRTIGEAVSGGNENLEHPTNRPQGRDTIYIDFEQSTLDKVIKKYHLVPKKNNIIIRICSRLKRLIK